MFNPRSNVIKRFQAPVKIELENLEEALSLVFESDIPLVNEICRYVADSQGKHIRPTVLFLAGKSIGCEGEGMLTAL